MRRMILLAIVALMVAAMAAGPAFALPPPGVSPCPPCPVTANDEAEGSFFTGSGSAHTKSGGKADQGLDTALMNNVNP